VLYNLSPFHSFSCCDYRKLPRLLDQFPVFQCKYKILPHLINALDYGSGTNKVLGPLLKIGKKLEEDEYKTIIMPGVIRWFQSKNRRLRITLLEHLKDFVHHLDAKIINETIFPPVSIGLLDTSPNLRNATLDSLTYFAPALNDKIIHSHLLPNLAKLQGDQVSAIRQKTTQKIGEMAKYFSQKVRGTTHNNRLGVILISSFSGSRSSVV